VQPTIFAGVDPNAVIAQEEIFGPVLSMIPYTTEDEAIIPGLIWPSRKIRRGMA
jgi:acyl-CoA reductase-like NAD-dependent aldehyde dehydrogenase